MELRASLVQAATSAKLFEQTPGVKQNTRVRLLRIGFLVSWFSAPGNYSSNFIRCDTRD